MLHLRLAAVAVVVATISACASDYGGSISGGKDALSPEERRLQAVETRVAPLARRGDSVHLTELGQSGQRVREVMRTLRGEAERLRYDVDQLKRGQAALQARLQRLEAGAAPAAATPAYGASAPSGAAPAYPATTPAQQIPMPAAAAPATAGVAGPTAVAPATDGPSATISQGSGPAASADEQAAYLAAFDLLGNGKYDDAIKSFRSQLERWPQGRYADAALYWSGEAYYVKRDYNSALAAFQAVLQRFPQSTKLPEALLKVGLTQMDMGRDAEGRTTLQRVIKTYPQTTAAKLAQQRLEPAKR